MSSDLVQLQDAFFSFFHDTVQLSHMAYQPFKLTLSHNT